MYKEVGLQIKQSYCRLKINIRTPNSSILSLNQINISHSNQLASITNLNLYFEQMASYLIYKVNKIC
jgi:hypothetical protein